MNAASSINEQFGVRAFNHYQAHTMEPREFRFDKLICDISVGCELIWCIVSNHLEFRVIFMAISGRWTLNTVHTGHIHQSKMQHFINICLYSFIEKDKSITHSDCIRVMMIMMMVWMFECLVCCFFLWNQFNLQTQKETEQNL